MVAETRTPAQPAYKPTIRLVDIHQGLYLVSSSDGTTFYSVDVVATTCTCKAGQNGFANCRRLPYCKHVAAAKYWAKCLHDTRVASRRAALQPAA